MNRNHFVRTIAPIVILLGILLSACNTGENPATLGEPVAIKIAVLPILDTLPMYVAQSEELFTAHNVEVEFVAASSAPKRDELVKSGQVDGMINEVVSVIFYNREETQIQIVRYARVATADSPMFRILSAGQSGITELEGLKGVPIGVSQGTVIEYLTDRLLQAEGYSPEEIQVITVPDIGQRMTLLGSGELEAAVLPDPLASMVMGQGAALILDDSSHPEFAHSVYSFRADFIDQHPEAVRGFLAAVEEAVALINADSQKYEQLLAEQGLVPPPLQGKFPVPYFVTAGVPSRSQWDDVVAWVNEKGLEAGEASYEESVNDSFLP